MAFGDFADQASERELANKQLCILLELFDIFESYHCAVLAYICDKITVLNILPGLKRSFLGLRVDFHLSRSLRGQILPRCFAAS